MDGSGSHVNIVKGTDPWLGVAGTNLLAEAGCNPGRHAFVTSDREGVATITWSTVSDRACKLT